ncbi:alcohol dehydrogenase catalytic domain-containing protein [Aeromicrobium sp. YIM 150415]|uniref:alcohol dehydrogenase catalytic domain-containing protein n=1 Tax=Aeromicrobium sp. YIM 150415 TaxID=2803912 RepID=UPI001966B6A5|nr:alcohol dehydrogenase catalytic domain-containing protein [Aeromicrobium sp. YIM 150415]MBM9464401.1 alcohol dehydrogenase catalytic domain-containing protein [Aeromicrobium sp. YIM 150415]
MSTSALVFQGYGGPEVLAPVVVELPPPGPAQVLVRVEATGVCGHDVADRAGLTSMPLPLTLGHEIAGTVVETGAAVRHVQVGDRVACKQHHTCGWCTACRSGRELDCPDKQFVYGGYAEHVLLEEDTLAVVPDGILPAAAAIAACAIGSSLQAIEVVARLQPGETVAITGAGGGLGLHALQVASALGARVIAVTSSPAKSALLRRHGADEVAIGGDDLPTQLLDLTGGAGVEVVIDNVGLPSLFGGCFKGLGTRGRYVLTGQLKRERISLFPAFVFFKEAVITGSASTSTASFLRSLDLLASGAVTAVTTEYRLADAALAHADVEASRVSGRAVLVP